ncbi:MAG: hypothetical protein H6733_14015 [Alphaproteobacteria bacterium]|nr:hypothetical protein [Alphaproteobacteria bacterium]
MSRDGGAFCTVTASDVIVSLTPTPSLATALTCTVWSRTKRLAARVGPVTPVTVEPSTVHV